MLNMFISGGVAGICQSTRRLGTAVSPQRRNSRYLQHCDLPRPPFEARAVRLASAIAKMLIQTWRTL